MEAYRCSWRLVVLLSAIAAVPLGPMPAWGQASLRPSPSPLAPPDSSRPTFDTAEPRYDGNQPGSRAGATVVAEVDGQAITLGDVGDAVRSLPASVASMPFDILMPTILDQLVQRAALAARARQAGVDELPEVRRRVQAAAEQTLVNEYLNHAIADRISEAEVLARYRRDDAGKPGPDEVRVRVIMLLTEAEAAAIITELRGGADFATVAKRVSRDPTAAAGGDLGFTARDTLTPEIGAVAFALPVGQYSAYPVRSGGAWFVVQAAERRQQPTPPFSVVRAQIQQAMMKEALPSNVRDALATVTVRTYDVGGRATQDGRTQDR
jgi:peptidyl-prolyl cis-trans isomerase C